MKPTSLLKSTHRIARWIPATILLLLSCYYFSNVYAIIRDSIRITGEFGTFETILLLWAVAPWALLVAGLVRERGGSRTK